MIGAAGLYVLAALCIQVLLIWAAASAVALVLLLLGAFCLWKRWRE